MNNSTQSTTTNQLQPLKYSIIKTKLQYDDYCQLLEKLLDSEQSKYLEDEIDLLTLLIEKWDEENNTFEESDPIELLQYLMTENSLQAKDLTEILHVSKGLISDILNYKTGLSKDIIRLLSDYFKVAQEAFNRPYQLKTSANLHSKV